MKKLLLFSLIAIWAICSCSRNNDIVEQNISDAQVLVETMLDENGNDVVRITPGESTVRFDYAVGIDGSVEKFLNGEMGIMSSDGAEIIDISIEELQKGQYYTVVAQGYDDVGNKGAVSSVTVSTSGKGLSIELSYLTESSVGILINSDSGNYMDIYYYLGCEEDRDKFYQGDELSDGYVESIMAYNGANYFDLEPGKEYVFYVKAKDRKGIPFHEEFKFSTLSSENDCPSVSYEIVSSDAYRTTYRIMGNDKAVKVAAFPHDLNDVTSETVMYGEGGQRGNIKKVFEDWLEIGFKVKSSTDENSFEFSVDNVDFLNDVEVDLYLMAMDENGEIVSIYKDNMVIAEYDESAAQATCEVAVSDVTSSGAKYVFTPDTNTMAIFIETVEADWFDEFSKTEEYHDFYLHERFFNQGYFSYGNKPVEYVETTGQTNTRYYAAVCPMNKNGLKGWGKLEMKEYTTLK